MPGGRRSELASGRILVDGAVVLRGEHKWPGAPAHLPGGDRPYPPAADRARDPGARQRLRRRLGGGRGAALSGGPGDPPRPPRRPGGEQLAAPTRGPRAFLPVAERGFRDPRGWSGGPARGAERRPRGGRRRGSAPRPRPPADSLRVAVARARHGPGTGPVPAP